MQLSASLLEWFDKNKRELPFRKNRNLYSIWISEVMLQQTKVDTVIPYFNSWIKKFPNINAVAQASEESILKSWEGLGYYSRCRNFHKAAKIIVNDYGSKIPVDWENFRSLPGVGDYTAGAVLSIAFNKNYVAIDGNVKRVVSRIIGRKKLSKYNLNYIKSFLLKNMDRNRAGDFNEAVMELGACICLPRSPKCKRCPIKSFCSGYKSGRPNDYPQKLAKKRIPLYTFVGGVIRFEEKILIQKRDDQMLNGLWEIPIKKTNLKKNYIEFFKKYIFDKYGYIISFKKIISEVEHVYSHFKMKLVVIDFIKNDNIKNTGTSFSWVSKSDINSYAFHRVNHKVFKLFKDPNWDV